MHSSDKKLSKDINSIIDKYKFLDESKIEENMIDEFFDELKNAIDRSKNESYNIMRNNIRKRKLKKIFKRNEKNR